MTDQCKHRGGPALAYPPWMEVKGDSAGQSVSVKSARNAARCTGEIHPHFYPGIIKRRGRGQPWCEQELGVGCTNPDSSELYDTARARGHGRAAWPTPPLIIHDAPFPLAHLSDQTQPKHWGQEGSCQGCGGAGSPWGYLHNFLRVL